MRVAGVDLSLTSTGVAEVDTDGPFWTTLRIKTDAPVDRPWGQAARMDAIECQVMDALFALPDVAPQLVVVEGMSFGSRTAWSRDIGGLWWGLIRSLRRSGFDFDVLVVEPAVRAKYATGRGRGAGAGKSDVLAAVRATYPAVDVPGHDVADAVALAALGARMKGFPVEASAPAWVESVAAQVRLREQGKGQ